MRSDESYSARSATPLRPVRKARVDIALKVLTDTAKDLRLEARLRQQADPGDEAAAALTEEATRLDLVASYLETSAPKA